VADRAPAPDWPPWTAPVALIAGVVLAALGGLIVDLPALALGVKLTSSHTPAGLAIADTFVQDLAFVAAAVFCAHLGVRRARGWQFGLRRPRVGWLSSAGMIVLLLVAFVVLTLVWQALCAGLTCVVAPICEEFLFRGFIFRALANWRGALPAAAMTAVLFGAVHYGSAPKLDLVPLALLGFGLCLLYRASGSLYPCMAAHSLNNSVAFASLEKWSWQMPLLMAAALAGVGAVMLAVSRLGLSGDPVLV
jgi:membrane protease YdiL (CAAX protease family)